jgi:SAM-dependent methyltransferase
MKKAVNVELCWLSQSHRITTITKSRRRVRQTCPRREKSISGAIRQPGLKGEDPLSLPTQDARSVSGGHRCRFCARPLTQTMVDLGVSPLCESYLRADQLDQMEAFYPLKVEVCDGCLLAQVPSYVTPEEIFSEYGYFSSYSSSWVEHARRYVEMITERLRLTADSLVVELASNDGYLLRHFLGRGPRILGVEPAENVAVAAIELGIPTVVRFFGEDCAKELAAEHGRAELIVGNNVLAQVPDLNDFIRGMRELLAADGVITLEFPHLLKLLEENQFDTIYHEHFSYFSLLSCERIFGAHDLVVSDVEEIPSHGGSLRIYVQHTEAASAGISDAVDRLRDVELAAGLDDMATYNRFTDQVQRTKRELLQFLVASKAGGKRIVGYGAPGKGNTMLNYCGVSTDFLDFTVDRSEYKQGMFTPGARLPILHPDAIRDAKPDVILILPWNLKKEIAADLAYTREWGAELVVAIPTTEVIT